MKAFGGVDVWIQVLLPSVLVGGEYDMHSQFAGHFDNNLRGLKPRANYTDRATAACRRS
jgi:hypothetical protein